MLPITITLLPLSEPQVGDDDHGRPNTGRALGFGRLGMRISELINSAMVGPRKSIGLRSQKG